MQESDFQGMQNYWNQPGVYGGDRGWQDRNQNIIDLLGMHKFGVSNFLPGQQYGPGQIMGQYQQSMNQPMPFMSAPSAGGAQQYGLAAMGMAGRGNAMQMGHAAQGLTGMSPAARASALAQMGSQSAGNVGQAGMQGMMQGGNWLQQAAQQNYGGQMNERNYLQQLYANALQQSMQAGMYGADAYWGGQFGGMQQRQGRRDADRAANQQLAGQAIGAAAQIPFMI